MYKRCLIAGAIMLGAFGCGPGTESPTAPAETPLASARATVALEFQELSAGAFRTCGLTRDGRAYCWGLDAGSSIRLPVAVPGGLRFRQISTGLYVTCGVATNYLAYCWGSDNSTGQLGDGTRTPHSMPAPVAGGHRLQQVDVSAYHVCGVSYHDGRVYCWGSNSNGQLGDGTRTSHLTPVPVASALRFKQVATGSGHTCAVTINNWAYCWGGNGTGQIGDSTSVLRRTSPVRVAGNHHFRRIGAGNAHTCALTTDGRAFCWGHGLDGQLGNGETSLSFWPRAVAGGLHFRQLASGSWSNCAVTPSSKAYCWGLGPQNGDGTYFTRLRPVAVAGGLAFRQITDGRAHACGVTTIGAGYCWGSNRYGEFGNGTTESSPSPTKVGGPS